MLSGNMNFSNKLFFDIDEIIKYLVVSPNTAQKEVDRREEEIFNNKRNKRFNHNRVEKGYDLVNNIDYIKIIPIEYNSIKIKDLSTLAPAIPIQRVPSYVLGQGVLGRCYTGSNLIQIREDLYDRDFQEVDVHEQKHALSPYMSEYSVRFWTRALFNSTRYN